MKKINLLSLVQAKSTLNSNVYKTYCEYLKIKPKDIEVEDLKSLIEQIEIITSNKSIFD